MDSKDTDHFKDLPVRLKALLARKGVSQKELHERSGVSISRISEYVTGKNGPPTLSTLSRILNALGARRSDLFPESDAEQDEREPETRRLKSRVTRVEQKSVFLEAEIGRLERAIEELRKGRGTAGPEGGK